MTAWKRSPRNRKRLIARIVLAVSTLGEAFALYKLGAHQDFVSAYLIVATWAKDFVHRLIVELAGRSPFGARPAFAH